MGTSHASTTVVTKWQKPNDVCSGRGERWLDGPVANTTRRDDAERKAASCPPDSRRVVALRAHSRAPSRAGQTPLAFERRERTGAVRPLFFLLLTLFCRL